MRGTTVSFFCLCGLDDREIAERVGWDEQHVARIGRKYVNAGRTVRNTVERVTDKSSRRAPNRVTGKGAEYW